MTGLRGPDCLDLRDAFERGAGEWNARRGPNRPHGTRERILNAAERLFAEHGVYAVSNRRVSEAAQQGNNAAVGYHFGTKADLVRAIARKHEQADRGDPRTAGWPGSRTPRT